MSYEWRMSYSIYCIYTPAPSNSNLLTGLQTCMSTIIECVDLEEQGPWADAYAHHIICCSCKGSWSVMGAAEQARTITRLGILRTFVFTAFPGRPHASSALVVFASVTPIGHFYIGNSSNSRYIGMIPWWTGRGTPSRKGKTPLVGLVQSFPSV